MKPIRMPRRQRVFAVLPTLLTLGNAVCGFGALTFAAKVGLIQRMGWGNDDTQCLFISALLIYLAMVFDMLDGRVARWAKQTSEFGAQLDSLCDALSFGVAPAFILIKFSLDFHPRLLWMTAVLFVLCAILRLARFNVETDDEDSHEFFSGLPSPAAAGTVASFMIAYPELEQLRASQPGLAATLWERSWHQLAVQLVPALKFMVPLVALACACLMVSRVRYSHVSNQWFRGRRGYHHMLLLVLGGAAVFTFRELAVPLIFCMFAFGSPLRAFWQRLHHRRVAEHAATTEPKLPAEPNADDRAAG